jgi:peptide/nickel transport system substrate-binding protein
MAAFCARQNDGIVLTDQAQLATLKACAPDLGAGQPLNSFAPQYRFHLERAPYNDVRVRRAFHLAMDRQEILNINSQGQGGVNGFLVPALSQDTGWGIRWSEMLQQPGFRQPKDADVAEARRLLAEAGYPNGFKTKLSYTTELSSHESIMTIYSGQLKKIGIEVEPINQDLPTITKFANDGTGPEDVNFYSANINVPTINSALQNFWHSRGGFVGTFGWKGDPALDQLIERITVEMDLDRRKAIFADIQKYFMDQVLLVPTVSYPTPQVFQGYMHNQCTNNSGQFVPRCGADSWMEVDKAPPDRRTR